MSQLRGLEADESMPAGVRDAARRLTTKVTEHFGSPSPTDPLEDSRIIIDHVLAYDP